MTNRKVLSLVLGLLVIVTTAGMRAAKPAAELRTIAPIVVKDITHFEAMEEVANTYLQETFNGTGNVLQAFQAAATVLGVIETHFHSGSTNALIVYFPPVPPPVQQYAQQAGVVAESSARTSSDGESKEGATEDGKEGSREDETSEDEGDGEPAQCTASNQQTSTYSSEGILDVWLTLEDEVAELEDYTGTTTSHGDVDLGLGFSGDWIKRFTPNDKWDARAGGHTTWGIYPDAVNCADLGGNFGLFYNSIDYVNGGPGTHIVTIGWTWPR